MPSRTSVLVALIAVLSGVAAFIGVRTWFISATAAAGVPAMLTVQTQPAGADVVIDNGPRGKTPLTTRLEPGAHTMTIRAGVAERTVQLTVTSGAQLSQYFDLSAGQGPGRLSIVTDPPGARVSIDGRPRGVSPLLVDDLAPAEHVVAVNSNTGSAQRSIVV